MFGNFRGTSFVAFFFHSQLPPFSSSLMVLIFVVIRDTQLLVASDGLRVVLQALSDGPHDFSPFLAMGFLWVVDKPGTRHYLRPGVDIEVCILFPPLCHIFSDKAFVP